ncbi:hypothetical protein [Rhodococcus sp. Eu-32]|uniref:hypothetical protein n=1 Tax=Rhodococcus sp. Eu-32 TaxID=1017319 RepID=UPI0014027B0E|nr:hypothetical protein [Rhodococcus sp. Eu-32]
MTRRIDEHVHHDTSEEQYDSRHRQRPKSLAEWDVEWARQERIERTVAKRARNRVAV